MKSFKKNGPEFIVLNEYDFNWDFVGQATDPFDRLDQYEL